MANEITHQRKIIEAVRQQGGWGSKWASKLQAGRPDLILCLPEMGMFAAEVKRVAPKSDDWSRAIKLTALQRETLRRIVSAGGLAMVMVVIELQRNWERRIAALPWHAEVLKSDLIDEGRCATIHVQRGQTPDIAKLVRIFEEKYR